MNSISRERVIRIRREYSAVEKALQAVFPSSRIELAEAARAKVFLVHYFNGRKIAFTVEGNFIAVGTPDKKEPAYVTANVRAQIERCVALLADILKPPARGEEVFKPKATKRVRKKEATGGWVDEEVTGPDRWVWGGPSWMRRD